jgi:hypothetical protein
LGDDEMIHKYYIAKEMLENDFGLQVVTMPYALKGRKFEQWKCCSKLLFAQGSKKYFQEGLIYGEQISLCYGWV